MKRLLLILLLLLLPACQTARVKPAPNFNIPQRIEQTQDIVYQQDMHVEEFKKPLWRREAPIWSK